MIRTVVVTLLMAPLLSVSADAQQMGSIRDKMDWINNYMQFYVSSPRDPGDTDAEAQVKAMLHGRMLAYRQVLERMEGVAVMGAGTADARKIKDFGAFGAGKSNIPLPGIVLKDIEETRARDGSRIYNLVYQTPLTGKGSLLSSVWQNIRGEVEANPPDQVAAPEVPPTSTAAFDPNQRYTGLAVDLRGLRITQAPVVSVLSENDNREVYGVMRATTEYVNQHGMVGYARSLSQPASIADRIGDAPLVVKAIRMEGCNPVVSEQDAARVAYADQLTHFLPKCRVAFLVGER